MRGIRYACGFGLSCLVVLLAGCGSSGGMTGGGGTILDTNSDIPVTVTFNGLSAPSAVAMQTGTSPFTVASLQNNQLVINLPSMTSKYSIAWVCEQYPDDYEYVLEVTPRDGIAYSVGCPDGFYQTAGNQQSTAIASVDASAIAGVSRVDIFGKQGYAGSMWGVSGEFGVDMPSGSNDIALVAIDGSLQALAVKILPGQTLPGAVNGGDPIVFSSADLLTMAPLHLTHAPDGFDPPFAELTYFTAGGTPVNLTETALFTQYPVVPAASTQSSDVYQFRATTSDTATQNSAIQVTQNTSGGGPVTIAFPPPWPYSGPAPALFPTFTFNYSGFTGMGTVIQEVYMSWFKPTTMGLLRIEILATGSFQNGATTLEVPDLSKLSGFPFPLTSVFDPGWRAVITGSPEPEMGFLPVVLANGSMVTVENWGSVP